MKIWLFSVKLMMVFLSLGHANIFPNQNPISSLLLTFPIGGFIVEDSLFWASSDADCAADDEDNVFTFCFRTPKPNQPASQPRLLFSFQQTDFPNFFLPIDKYTFFRRLFRLLFSPSLSASERFKNICNS